MNKETLEEANIINNLIEKTKDEIEIIKKTIDEKRYEYKALLYFANEKEIIEFFKKIVKRKEKQLEELEEELKAI